MGACTRCGAAYDGEPRFCVQCAAPLTIAAAAPVEERKVVTVLFCDLVDFTSHAEDADPEDVHAMLDRYATIARGAIATFGGTVEKFIGDAVVGVFGVPHSHEDDNERAVRAALRILEDAADLTTRSGEPVRLRVGVNTGETLVRLDVDIASGARFLAGDAVNTAARIQTLAPLGGVAVGESVYDATRSTFEYEALGTSQVKGRSAPVRAFRALEPRARFGSDLTSADASTFVGRSADLAVLVSAFDEAVAYRRPRLVTVVADPGLGKSRLVAELFGAIDSRPGLTTWRQGRCLPYGRSITYWALGEVVKAHAGILETDEPAAALTKLDHVLPVGEERAWFRQRLSPLLGVETAVTPEREELFTAWRRFLEHIADDGPFVLVLEDLHWADPAMLAFVDHLADELADVPLLLVVTARPELLEQHPRLGSGTAGSTLVLEPLSDHDTSALVSSMLDSAALPVQLQQSVLERAGGNPLYALEFVRLLVDRGLIIPRGGSWQLAGPGELPSPGSLQALIAARLDLLRPEAKSLLADAAVVGKVFWSGALRSMSGRDASSVDDLLQQLVRRNLVRPSRSTSMAGEREYSFGHVLTLDVAYSQLTRASRAARHVAAAEWIERKAPERVEDLADVLAHHYASAHTLRVSAGDEEAASHLEPRALRFLSLAGERAMGLDNDAALAAFARVVGLTPPGHPGRGPALGRYGLAAAQAARYVVAAAALEEAVELLGDAGDVEAMADARMTLRLVYVKSGDPRAAALTATMADLLEQLPAGRTRVRALSVLARIELNFFRDPGRARAHAGEALALAEELGLPLPTDAMGVRGSAAVMLGDRAGLRDHAEAIAVGTATGQGPAVGSEYNNYGIALWNLDGPAAGIAALREGIAYDVPRGLGDALELTQGTLLSLLYDAGGHEEALELADELAERFVAGGNMLELTEVRAIQLRIHHLRGETAIGEPWLDWLEVTSREAGRPEDLVVGLAPCAAAHADLGRRGRARELVEEISATPFSRRAQYYASVLPCLVRTAVLVGDVALGARLVEGVDASYAYLQHAMLAARATLLEADGRLADAADVHAEAAARWAEFGVATEELEALLGHGRCRVETGRAPAAAAPLLEARRRAEGLRARPHLARIDALLDATRARSS